MKVEVTQEDIDSARDALQSYAANRCFDCPVALGAKRAYNRPIKVGTRYLAYRERHLVHDIDLPEVAIAFIYDFDHQRTVSPFSFEVPDI